MSCQIRQVRSFKDVRELVTVHNNVWVRSTGIIDLLAESTACYIAVDNEDDCVAGYAFVEQDEGRGFAELNDIAVDPQYRGQGYGGQLMGHLMACCDEIKLCARAGKEELVRFYTRLGFRQETIYENYYGINHDALRMAWTRTKTAS